MKHLDITAIIRVGQLQTQLLWKYKGTMVCHFTEQSKRQVRMTKVWYQRDTTNPRITDLGHVTFTKLCVLKFVLCALYAPEIGCSHKIGRVVLLLFARNIEINMNLIHKLHDEAKLFQSVANINISKNNYWRLLIIGYEPQTRTQISKRIC